MLRLCRWANEACEAVTEAAGAGGCALVKQADKA